MNNEGKKFAVLIDADNAQPKVLVDILNKISLMGDAIVKRIYGDFTTQQSSCWKDLLQKNAIKPVQQFAYTTGKNATDSMLIIDAMDLLYTRAFDGFCLVSSDSDFTGLAIRLRESGLTVIGFGREKTPQSFKNACNEFIPTEESEKKQTNKDSGAKSVIKPESIDSIIQTLSEIIESFADKNEGWAHLGQIGSILTKRKPDFTPSKYGFKKLSAMLASKSDVFEVTRGLGKSRSDKPPYIRLKTGPNKSMKKKTSSAKNSG